MNWREVRAMLRKKLGAKLVEGTKHDLWHVYCDDVYVGKVKDVHGSGEVQSHERGGIADSLKVNEHAVRELVSCTITREEFCAMIKS